MTLLGIVLIALGARAAYDDDNQVYQTISGILVALIGAVLILLGQTSWLDSIFR